MKKNIVFVLLIIGLFMNSSQTFSQDSQKKWSIETAKSFIKQYSDPKVIHWKTDTNSFSWQAGYIMFAMEKLWQTTNDSIYFNYIKKYVDQHVDSLGNVSSFVDNALDNFLPGYAVLFMYEHTKAEKYKVAATKIHESFNTYPRNSDGLFWHADWAKNQAWVDGVFMGQIFNARYGSLIGDTENAYFEVVKQMILMYERCGKENGLILHGWDESKEASWADSINGLSPEVWSEGLGWYAVLIADVFDYLPKDYLGYDRLMSINKKLCEGLKNKQDSTGMWCQVVDKNNEPGNWNETSGTGMFIYLLQKSVNKAYINADEYQPIIDAAYQAIIKKAELNKKGYIDLIDCSSIGILNSYDAYISSPKEISPFAAFGSFIIATNISENQHPKDN